MIARIRKVNSHLEPEPTTSLVELGSSLRAVRETQALTLEEVAARTLIPVRLLKAIEEGCLEKLPEPVYIQGFIRRYAETLGLDGEAYAHAFPSKSVLKGTPNEQSWRTLLTPQLQPIHLYLLYIGLITIAISALSAHLKSSTQLGQELTSLSAQRVRPSSTQPSQATRAVSPTQSAPPTAMPRAAGVQISVIVREEAWVQVTADGKPTYEGNLAPGTQKTWQAKQNLTILSGNAGGILVSVNGATPKPLGVPGAVEEASFNASQVSKL